MITVIAPHARPEFSANLLANFRRQRGVEARLLVVENGEANWSAEQSPGVTVITSGAHQASAMNAGLGWLRAYGNGAWARFDDDDYYGPDYLAAAVSSLAGDGVVVSGMPWRFVLFDEGLHQFQGRGEFTGGSLAANTADIAPFPRARSDDLDWCRSMREHGARFVERPPWGYCYNRTTRSAPRVIEGGSAVTRFGFGASLFYGRLPASAVDRPGIEPLRSVMPPTDDEIVAALSGP